MLLLLELLPCNAASRLLSRPYTLTPEIPEPAEGLTGRPLSAADNGCVLSKPAVLLECLSGWAHLTDKQQ